MKTRLVWCACALALAVVGCDEERVTTDAGTSDSGMTVDSGVTADAGTDGGGGCTDVDEDGYGAGCALGPDCDDGNAAISPAATETCDGVDQDCDTMTDEGLSAPSCELTEGVCAGSVARCAGVDGFVCDETAYGADYEADEASCDALDNDCDGSTDESCTCTPDDTQPCGMDVGACMAGTQTCQADMTWGACDGEVGPMGEACDGLDNDCDGTEDEPGDLTAPNCALQLGVCAGSKRACGGGAGWITCAGTASYGGNYEAAEARCDSLDNDCDGVTDEGCECVDGATQGCGTDVGLCVAGMQTCTAGAWGACAGEVARVEETCDGADQDCDGATDEDLAAPACALQLGVCGGSTQPCSGAGGFTACAAADYGMNYQATETACDGRDNDCDGTVDEGCTCVDGRTQACGLSTGACTRGTQTCAAGVWGACTGGVEPVAETCNGVDDDCNGRTDDNLVAPSCALTMGVCTGTTQVCGGAAGWTACAGTDSYGPRFVTSEDGGANEGICDGLDNDCNGTVDDNCGSGPIVNGTPDEVLPDLFNRHLVYLSNFDGNWDVVFENLALSAGPRRLTTTPQNESSPKVYGNYAVWTRGEDAAARVVLYNLVTGTETVITSSQSGSPDISQAHVVYDQFDGSQWDVFLYDIAAGTSTNVFAGDVSSSNEVRPSMRGNRVALLSDMSGGPAITWLLDFGAGTATAQTPGATSVNGQLDPVVDFDRVAWTDGRAMSTASTAITDNWDIYGSLFVAAGTINAFPAENLITNAGSGQILNDIDGGILAWSDFRNGNWDPVLGDITGTTFFISTHPATQADLDLSGDIVVWEDNRLGSYDIYASTITGTFSGPAAGELVINEAMPNAGTVDTNGDGTAHAERDEYVEIINATARTIDLSGVTLSDVAGLKHTFAAGTVLPALGAIVVFSGVEAGGTVSGLFGGAQLVLASSGSLGLNNGAETLTLRSGATVIDTASWSSSTAGIAKTRMTQLGTDALVNHNTVSTRNLSPGLRRDGFAF